MATLTALAAAHGFTEGDLETSGQVAVLPAFQKVYFADGRPRYAANGDLLDIHESGYHKLDFINTRIVGTVVGTFTKGEMVTQADNDAQGIVDEVVTVGAETWTLIYRTTLTEFIAAKVITGANDGATVTPATAADIVAPPHWLNWTLTDGYFPDGGSNILALCWGRIFMNSLSNPNQWAATRRNNPLDLLFVQDDVDSATTSQTSGQAGLVGDQLIALINHKDNMMILGCLNHMYVMRADPQRGGFFATLADTTGIFSNTSFCWDDKNNLFWIGNDGIYVSSYDSMIGTPPSPPVNLTKEHLPKLISRMALNRRTDRVTMQYDKDRYGIQITVSQMDCQWKISIWIDLRTGGVFPETYTGLQVPTSLFYFDSRKKSERTLLAGCGDGYIRKWDDDEKSDEDAAGVSTAIESYAFIGPLVSSEIRGKITLNELSVRTGLDTDRLNVGLYSAKTAAQLIRNVNNLSAPKTLKEFTVDALLPSLRQSISDGAVGIMLSNTTLDSTWSVERMDADIEESGRLK